MSIHIYICTFIYYTCLYTLRIICYLYHKGRQRLSACGLFCQVAEWATSMNTKMQLPFRGKSSRTTVYSTWLVLLVDCFSNWRIISREVAGEATNTSRNSLDEVSPVEKWVDILVQMTSWNDSQSCSALSHFPDSRCFSVFWRCPSAPH